MTELRYISDVKIVEHMNENDTVLIEQNGAAKRIHADDLIPSDLVKSVNGNQPDERGNVTVDIPEVNLSEVVKSVNGNAPDENGNVQIETSSGECAFPGIIIDVTNTTKNYDTNDVLKSTARLSEAMTMLDEGKRVWLRYDDNRIPIIQLVKCNECVNGSALGYIDGYGPCIFEIGWAYSHGIEVVYDSYRVFTDNGIESADLPHIAGGVFEV